MRKILIVDCFDSFSYNLFHYLEKLNYGNCKVVRYDAFIPEDTSVYSHVVLSPGPGLPNDYPLIQKYLKIKNKKQSVLGVCLGLQSIAVFYKGELERLNNVRHGLSGKLQLKDESPLFKGLSSGFKIGHYHSWVVSEVNFPEKELKVTSRTSDGLIMSVEHRTLPLYALQFHPESILTENGRLLLKNWIDIPK